MRGGLVRSSCRLRRAPWPARSHRLLKRVRPSGTGQTQHRQIAIGRFLSDREIRAAGRHLSAAPPDAVFADTIFRSGVLAATPPAVRHRILIGHDVFHHRVASLRANGFEATPGVDRAMEERLYRQFTGIVSINASDDRTAREMAPLRGTRRSCQAPAARSSPRTGARMRANRLFYLGSLGAHNVDGLAWFLERVWPAIRLRLPDATLDVAGAIAERFPIRSRASPSTGASGILRRSPRNARLPSIRCGWAAASRSRWSTISGSASPASRREGRGRVPAGAHATVRGGRRGRVRRCGGRPPHRHRCADGDGGPGAGLPYAVLGCGCRRTGLEPSCGLSPAARS